MSRLVQRTLDAPGALRRRDVLQAGLLGFSLAELPLLAAPSPVRLDEDLNVILLMLVGGPSQLDTWDMKPEAPSEIRGPYRPIKTNVAGLEISEIFPRMAHHADKYAIVRAMHHNASATHDAGHQLMQTGRVFEGDACDPHAGCVAAKLMGDRGGVPAHVLLPRPIGATGGNLPHGQDAGFLGCELDPFVPRAGLGSDPAPLREALYLGSESNHSLHRYGRNRFGRSCLRAKRLVRSGVRFVTVNMFETVFDEVTWDIHGAEPFTHMEALGDRVGPMFDNAYASLLEDLDRAGELDRTLVVAGGEFGRTPKINPCGGRDHWTQCWSMLFAGGGVRGGQVIGESDAIGAEPKNRPTSPAEVVATIYQALGIDLETTLSGPQGRTVRILDEGVEPIAELFG